MSGIPIPRAVLGDDVANIVCLFAVSDSHGRPMAVYAALVRAVRKVSSS